MIWLPRAGLVVLLALLTGCAVTGPQEFHYQPPMERGARDAVVWPQPPEQTRYVYVGQLLGEQNLRPRESGEGQRLQRALRWLVGLGGGLGPEPTVLRRPHAVAVGADGRIFVADMGRPSIFVFDLAEPSLQVWDRAAPGLPLLAPSGLATDTDGGVLVADAERAEIYRLDRQGRPQGSFGAGHLLRPGGLARDETRGEIYVADIRAHAVKVFDESGRLLRTLGGPGEGAGRFNAPSHVAFADDQVYVTDAFNARVQVLSRDGETLGLIGRRGLYVGNLVRPKGVAVDAAGRVYVVESYYGHLLVFDGSGALLLPIATAGTELGGLYLPAGVAVDERQQVYLADMFNGRVLVLRYVGDE